MKRAFDFDGTLKQVFERDRPTLLRRLTGGVAIEGFLNVELPKVHERRVDLVISLANGAILHMELQSSNDPQMAYRMLEYWPLIKARFKRPLRQTVLYVGRHKMAIPSRLEEDRVRIDYDVVDFREIPVEPLLRSGNAGDLALAVLAGGGDGRLPEILGRAARIPGTRRKALLAILILSGLRGITGKVEWELERMGVIIDVRKNPVLMRWRREAIAEGLAEGRAKGRMEGRTEGRAEGRTEGRTEGMSLVLRELLETKFGPLPKWVGDRLSKATPARIELWAKRVLTANTLEGVLGKK
jgi:hypothetical protein